VGGGLLGHVLMPVRGGVVLWGRLCAFALAMLALGALRGWREGVLRGAPPSRLRRRAALYAVAALALATAGYALVHGAPR
jgi:hypothetical protein